MTSPFYLKTKTKTKDAKDKDSQGNDEKRVLKLIFDFLFCFFENPNFSKD
jgi:hypothetical protein